MLRAVNVAPFNAQQNRANALLNTTDVQLFGLSSGDVVLDLVEYNPDTLT